MYFGSWYLRRLEPVPAAVRRAGGSDQSLLVKYEVLTGKLLYSGVAATPKLGPRVISTNATGDTILAGWGLLDRDHHLLAQFPRPTGDYSRGSHAIDVKRNLIFGDIPDAPFTAAKDGLGVEPVMPEAILHVFAPDNLTVLERLHIPEELTGKAIFSKDSRRLYAISSSGVTVFDMDQYEQLPRVVAKQEDVLLKGNGCDRELLVGQIDIVDPNGRNLPFDLQLSDAIKGVRLAADSSTTPAHVRVEVNPVAFQDQKGTVAIPIKIHSDAAVNIPRDVRLLVNTRDPEQRGAITNIPGSVVDMLPDPIRDRIYLLRQDTNEVLVYDTNLERITARLRTGNTPVGMTIVSARSWLLVGNDNSSLINVYDLESLQPLPPVFTSIGQYPRTLAAVNGSIWATARLVGTCEGGGASGLLLRVDPWGKTAIPPAHLGPYLNCVDENSVLAASPSGEVMFVASPDGTVMRYDAADDGFSAGRLDFSSLSGGYGAIGNSLFMVGGQVLNGSLVPVQRVDGSGITSGFAMSSDGSGLAVSTSGNSGPSVIRKIALDTMAAIAPSYTAEAARTADMTKYVPIGQIGQTVLPFTRTLAPLRDGASVLVQTVSGVTKLPASFDQPMAAPSLISVSNMADGSTAIAPGSLIRIAGHDLTDTPERTGDTPYPTSLGGLCATVNGVAVPMYSVDAQEIRGQLPQDATGHATLAVRTVGGAAMIALDVKTSAPAVFRSGMAGDLSGLATVVRAANNQLVTGTNPVRMNDVLSIYVTGVGRTSPSVRDGDAAPMDAISFAAAVPTVTLGGVALPVQFAGLTPGMVGVGQINAFVPESIPEGLEVPLKIAAGEYETTVNVRVVKP